MKKTWTRRHFLAAAGVSSAGAFLGTILPTPAAAAGAGRRRIVFLNNAQGTDMTSWSPENGAAGLDLSYQLEPLSEYRENLVVLDGIDSNGAISTGADGTRADGGHEGLAALLTGRPYPSIDGNAQAGGPSVDQVIAHRLQLRALDAGEEATRFPALRIGRAKADADEPPEVAGTNNVVNGYYWLERGLSAPLLHGPWAAYSAIFADFVGGDAALGRLRMERRSVLDAVSSDLRRTRDELPVEDRDYMERHLAAIRGIEENLDRIVECAAPSIADRPSGGALRQWNDGEAEDLQMATTLQVIAAALTCGLTDVACYAAQRQEGTANVLKQLPEFAETYASVSSIDLHGAAHGMITDYQDAGLSREEADRNRQVWADLYRWRADSLKRHLLDALPEPIRDETMVMWASEMSEGASHSNHNVPITLFQGANIECFRTNEVVRWTGYDPIESPRPRDTPRGDMTRLCVSLCNAMGLEDVSEFGDEAYPQGPLMEALR